VTHRAYLGIGSNLGDPGVNVRAGIGALADVGSVVAQSSLYRTKPWGVGDQPDYINAVVYLETALKPRVLLLELKKQEVLLGRVTSARWAPRIIDFDILTYDDVRIDDGALRIPHPQMLLRAFVLVPLAEIDESYVAARDALDPNELATVRLDVPSRA
jgi:2-amino-4-hydroxy-6-hydroxymethyldihydropteridine diphosphokinase